MECFTNDAIQLEGRLDPHFYRPEFKQLAATLKKLHHKKLGEAVEFASETWNQKDGVGDTFPYIEISGIDTLTGEILNIDNCDKAEAPSRAKMIVHNGDIIVSTTRPNRGAIASIDKEQDGYIASTGFAILRSLKTDDLSKEYLFYALRMPFSLNQMLQRSSGGNYPAITPEELKKVIIPAPSPLIQKNVVEIMLSAYEQKKQKEQEAEKQMLSIEELLFTELGITFPTLIEKQVFTLHAEDIEGRIDSYYYQPKFVQAEQALERGKYKLIPLKDLFTDKLVKGTLPNDEEKSGNKQVIQIGNIHRDGSIDVSETLSAKDIFSDKQKLSQGDILIVITGATIGKVGLWLPTKDVFYLGGDIVKFQPKEDFNSYFIQAFLLSRFGQLQIKRHITGATNKHLAPTDVERIKIPAPPSPVQHRIAEAVKSRIAKAEQLRRESRSYVDEAKQKVEDLILGK